MEDLSNLEEKLSISLRAEPIFDIAGLAITNSMLTTVLVGIILSLLMISAARNAKVVPSRWQAFWEFVVESQLNVAEGAMGRVVGRQLFPILTTFFIYIIFANWFSLLPGIGTIGFYERSIEVPNDKTLAISAPDTRYGLTNSVVNVTNGSGQAAAQFPANTMLKLDNKTDTTALATPVGATASTHDQPVEGLSPGIVQLNQLSGAHEVKTLIPIFRAPNADLNMTLGMALISIILVQILAIRAHGFGGYIKEFFPKPRAFDVILTPVEIIGQFSRILSLTFRLFGNVFAGEALLAIILKIGFPVLAIFIGLELFFGFIQALVFSGLSTAYFTLAVTGQEGGHGTNEDEPHQDEDSHLDERARYAQQSETVEKEAVGATR